MQTHSNHSKTKKLPILTSNERIIIPKSQLTSNFSNLRGKRKLVRKIGYFEKSGVTKITVSDEGGGNDFCFQLSGGSKKWGFKSSVFNCGYFSWNLAYNLTSIDCPVKSKTCYRNSKFFLVGKVQEHFETVLCGAIENGSFQNHHKKKSTTQDKSVEAFQCSFQFRFMQPSGPKGTNSPPSPPLVQCCFGLTAQVCTVNNIAIGEGEKRSFNLQLKAFLSC